jgi:hypothetical protein
MMLSGTLQQFDEGSTREGSFMALADAEGMVLAFPFPFLSFYSCLYLFHVINNAVVMSASSCARR